MTNAFETAARRTGMLFTGSIAFILAGCSHGDLRGNDRLIDGIVATARGIGAIDRDPYFERVVAAQRTLPREWFLPSRMRFAASLQQPLLIGYGQTISDPLIVTVMTTAAHVRPGAAVLEIGTGSGYQAAVLSRLGARVVTIEIVPQLARSAAATLKRHRITNVEVHTGDGRSGWPSRSPFDAILVTAGAPAVPQRLLDQLSPGGRLVMPVGDVAPDEQLLVYERRPTGPTVCSLGPATFVPLTGRRDVRVADRPPETPPLCYGRPTT